MSAERGQRSCLHSPDVPRQPKGHGGLGSLPWVAASQAGFAREHKYFEGPSGERDGTKRKQDTERLYFLSAGSRV